VRLDSSCKDKLAFKAVLSFAVGGLLGDVLLHLLPEAYGTGPAAQEAERAGAGAAIGLWMLVGLLSFLMMAKAVKMTEALGGSSETLSETAANLCTETIGSGNTMNGSISCSFKSEFSNGVSKQTVGKNDTKDDCLKIHSVPLKSKPDTHTDKSNSVPQWLDKDISGYLNLVANSTDNFTHGLAIAASYVASPAVGMLTTLAILCHEIPHEVGDFAILLNSGFSLREAAKAQMLTACGGLVGVVAGLTAEHISSSSSWLLPFTAGGFLYIALVSIVPDLLESAHSVRHSLIEMLALGMGLVVMALVTIVEKKSCTYMPPAGTAVS